MERTLHLPRPVPGPLAGELASRVFFVSPDIKDFVLSTDGDGNVVAVELALTDDARADAVERRLLGVVETQVLAQRPTPQKILWRSSAAENDVRDVFPQLLARRIAVPAGEGQMVLGSPVLELIDALDARLRDLVATSFGACERRYPTLLPTWVLDRCGYFTSFPQFVMFVTRLHGDVDTYRDFHVEAAAGSPDGATILRHCADVDYCLPPTMCFHTFQELDGARLPAGGTVYTSRGKSFRHESRYHRSLERLWDFTIRETVFLGERGFVLDARERFMRATCDLVQQLDLPGFCEVGNDPFFADGGTAERVWSQRLLELKYELRLALEPGRSVAVASFNFHDTFFGEPFRIQLAEGGTAYTACTGVGLERLAYAFLCRHGLDPANWPDLSLTSQEER